MHSFLTRFAVLVRGVLSGFDRLFFCGTLRNLAHCRGLQHYLWAHRIPYKDFAAHSLEVTARLEEASLRQARRWPAYNGASRPRTRPAGHYGRPVRSQ